MARVVGLADRAPGVFEIEIDREGLDYQVGDCTLLVRADRVDSRPYSFSSHPDEPVLRFLVRRLEGLGAERSFSQWLGSRQPGDEVGVGTPFGWFRPGRSPDEVWFATGTGVSPFLAALRGTRAFRPRSLHVGVRSPEDAVLPAWVADRAPVSWAYSRSTALGPARRVTGDAETVEFGPETHFYLCGHQRMIVEAANILKARGVDPGRIHEELFFP